jgi:hypothetical protein
VSAFHPKQTLASAVSCRLLIEDFVIKLGIRPLWALPIGRRSLINSPMGSDHEPMVNSGAWIRTRTDEQLQAHIDGSYPGAQQDAARQELRDRAAAREAKRQRRWIVATFWMTIALGLGGIAATVLSS